MIRLGDQTIALIESALKMLPEKLGVTSESQTLITDIHLHPSNKDGLLFIFDDDDNELAQIEVKEWLESDKETFYHDVADSLYPLVNKLHNEGLFENLPLLKPFSFVLVDNEHETVSELLLVDDDTMMLSEELLKGLDKELDDFLKHLLEE